MNKDWTGNKASTFVTLGASSHARGARQVDDYYATQPLAVELLLKEESFNQNILEPACGEGHISKVLEDNNFKVFSFDKVDRGYGLVKDFFEFPSWSGDIITNPPYKFAQEFVEHALKIIPEGNKVAMFCKLLFLEGKARQKMYKENPPKVIYVASGRLNCAKNGDFACYSSSAVCYAWFVWEKGFKGDPIIKWIN